MSIFLLFRNYLDKISAASKDNLSSCFPICKNSFKFITLLSASFAYGMATYLVISLAEDFLEEEVAELWVTLALLFLVRISFCLLHFFCLFLGSNI